MKAASSLSYALAAIATNGLTGLHQYGRQLTIRYTTRIHRAREWFGILGNRKRCGWFLDDNLLEVMVYAVSGGLRALSQDGPFSPGSEIVNAMS